MGGVSTLGGREGFIISGLHWFVLLVVDWVLTCVCVGEGVYLVLMVLGVTWEEDVIVAGAIHPWKMVLGLHCCSLGRITVSQQLLLLVRPLCGCKLR